ncbi:MAG: hypothetical protein WC992_00320 [Acholeplasmataceae bacterium]
MTEQKITELKLQILTEMSEQGVLPSDIGGALKKAAAALPEAKSAFVLNPLGGAADLAKVLAFALAATAVGSGAAAGYGAQRLMGDRPEDVSKAKLTDATMRLRQMTARLRAEHGAMEEEKKKREKRDGRQRRTGSSVLQIQSAF